MSAAHRQPQEGVASTNADFVELTEDVSGSPLWNHDLAPTSLASRTWSTYHIAALWIGMSVVITTYTLASGLAQTFAWYLREGLDSREVDYSAEDALLRTLR